MLGGAGKLDPCSKNSGDSGEAGLAAEGRLQHKSDTPVIRHGQS